MGAVKRYGSNVPPAADSPPRLRAGPLRAGSEPSRVLDRRKSRTECVLIAIDRTGLGVRVGQGYPDVRQPCGEHPVRVERIHASVQHLRDYLDVRRPEEPEVSGVTGQGN